MIPDLPGRADSPLVAGGEGNTGRGPSHDAAPAGTSCWLCGRPINDPPEIVGRWSATRVRVAHRHCLQILGELDLDLPGA